MIFCNIDYSIIPMISTRFDILPFTKNKCNTKTHIQQFNTKHYMVKNVLENMLLIMLTEYFKININ